MRIQDVELVPERGSYKVDGSGRIIIPAYMKSKFQIDNGDYMEYYTAYVDGKWFICATMDIPRTQQARKEKAEAAAAKKKKATQ